MRLYDRWGGGSETVTAVFNNWIATRSGSDSGLINTLGEWIDAASVNGVIAAPADGTKAVGSVVFQFSGNTYVVESNETFNNSTPNVLIANVIELTGLKSFSAAADTATASTILIS